MQSRREARAILIFFLALFSSMAVQDALASEAIGASPAVAFLNDENTARFAVLNFGDKPLFAELSAMERRASLSPRFVEIPPRQKAWVSVKVKGEKPADFLVLVKPKSAIDGFSIVPAASVRIRSRNKGGGLAVLDPQEPEKVSMAMATPPLTGKKKIAKRVQSRISLEAASLLALSLTALAIASAVRIRK